MKPVSVASSDCVSELFERPITFDAGGEELLGILHSPTPQRSAADSSNAGRGPIHGLGVVIVVGGPQYRVGSHRQFLLMARALARSGFSVFRFDYRGMGDSAGAPRDFEDTAADIRAAIDAFLREEPAVSAVALWGLCDGASASLLYCNCDSRVQALILANPWVRTTAGEARARLRHYYVRRLFQWSFWRSVLLGGLNVRDSVRDFHQSLVGARVSEASGEVRGESFVVRMREGLGSFRGRVLLLISERDLVAREFMDLCQTSRQWRASLGRPGVQVAHVSGSDHTFSSRDALERATEACRAWLAGDSCP